MITNLFNHSNVASQAIDGFLNVSRGTLARVADKDYKIVVRSDFESHKDKVAILAGGGAGHEPLHTEFVGRGMLTAAVCGEIFASPSVNAILSAILLVTGENGCLLIVKNYTGDRLNFGLAAELAKTRGKNVEMLLLADDIAIDKPERRRGIAGTLFIHKIAGHLSEQGFSLVKIKNECEKAAKGLYSIGFTISAADTLSGTEVIMFDPQVGRGIHNEAGTQFSFMTHDRAKEAVKKVLDYLVSETNDNSLYGLMINNLGGLTRLEMAIITNEVLNSGFKNRIKYVVGPGSFCTSLNMSGFSFSLLALTNDIEKALLSEVEPCAWVQPVTPLEPELIDVAHTLRHEYTPSENPENRRVINKICDVLISSKDKLNALDAHGGDGDSGDTLATIATRIKDELPNLPLDNQVHLLLAIGQLLSSVGGGTIGVLLSLLFTHTGIALETGLNFATALKEGVGMMMKYTGSQPGDRSILDALVPAIEALEETENLQVVAETSRKGADRTSTMIAQLGRAANVPPAVYLGFNDSGAEAIALIFKRLAENR